MTDKEEYEKEVQQIRENWMLRNAPDMAELFYGTKVDLKKEKNNGD